MENEEKVGQDQSEDKTDLTRGAFGASLVRNNKQIRHDRAEAIAEDAQMTYGRAIQDQEMLIKRMRRERENMLDLSPTNAQSLIVAGDFDARKFVERDVQLGIDIRNADIKLEIMKARFGVLFGETA
jgi:hypothetical protein